MKVFIIIGWKTMQVLLFHRFVNNPLPTNNNSDNFHFLFSELN